MSTPTANPRRTVALVGFAALMLVPTAACGPAGDDGARWAVVEDYLDRQAAWEAEAGSLQEMLVTGSGTLAERFERAEAAHGTLPDAGEAVAAAREIVAAGGLHTADAAEFLIERSASPLGMRDRTRELEAAAGANGAAAFARLRAAEDSIWEALITHVGTDWAVVERYLAERDASHGGDGTVHVGMHGQLGAIRAVAAARAILEAADTPTQDVEAVEFLARLTVVMPNSDRHLAAGARALRAQSPDFEDWPRVLGALDRARTHAAMRGGPDSPVDEFYAEMAAGAGNPVLRSGTRYYLACRSRRARERPDGVAGGPGGPPGTRPRNGDGPERRRGGRDVRRSGPAAGRPASPDVRRGRGSTCSPPSGTRPWAARCWSRTGRRLVGTEEPLSDYRRRVVLIDF